MSLQLIGERKRRRAERETGLEIERLLRVHNTLWEARVVVGDGHAHLSVDPRTWHVSVSSHACWSSCETPRVAVLAPYPYAHYAA